MMLEILTGAFSGLECAIVAGSVGYAVSRGKRFDFWILVVGVLFGLIAVQYGATFFGWQEWVYLIGALALFEYGSRFAYARVIKRRMEGRVKVGRGDVLFWAFIVFCVVFVAGWFIAFFTWFYPIVGKTFMFTELTEEGVEVFHWFAADMPQFERDVVTSYLLLGAPSVCVIAGFSFAFAISDFRNKRKQVQ